jgi:hypothetical protein
LQSRQLVTLIAGDFFRRANHRSFLFHRESDERRDHAQLRKTFIPDIDSLCPNSGRGCSDPAKAGFGFF